MKTLSTTLLLYVLAVTSVFSFPMSEMIGRWKYQNRATQNDTEVLRTQGFIEVTQTASRDFVFEETNTAGGAVASYTMFRNGRFRLTQGPAVSATGRWRETTNAIRVSGNITTPLGTHRFTTTFAKPTVNRLLITQLVPDVNTVSKWTAKRVVP